MHRREVRYKNVVVRDGDDWRLSTFLMGEKDSHSQRMLENVDNSLLTQKELDFIDEFCPVIDLPKDFNEQLDSPDKSTRELASMAFIMLLKSKIEKYV